ncbi:MAG: EF-P lysine aminoacylase EpmA [Kangiellaceae bacterium]|nr:EF-P lysine aminoacylase EpmA [Kangiellaceae bacterium]MCW9017631.1 EF-P lysine aminoacylase EpmA [Kangiellaceae bacterium]
MNVLLLRAKKLSQMRNYFAKNGALEVDTPLLRKHTVTDPYMNAMQVVDHQGKAKGFLQTSPEYAMKILLSSGSGDIYQLGKVFRADESGIHHSPEFTMLEWYRLGWTYLELIEEVHTIIELTAGKKKRVSFTYQQAFLEFLEFDPFTIRLSELKQIASEKLGELPDNMLFDNYLTLMFASLIEPAFDPQKVTYVTDFPASQASLARKRTVNGNAVANRFEAYSGGLELANGFEELTDSNEQLARFEEDNRLRKKLGYVTQEIDTCFINALKKGLPACSGVAVGFDRLLMLAANVESIREVLPINFGRTELNEDRN